MTPSDNERVTVIIDARFYDYKVADIKAMAESCTCGSYKCEKCQMRSNAVRLGWITKAMAEDFEFNDVPIDWDKAVKKTFACTRVIVKLVLQDCVSSARTI